MYPCVALSIHLLEHHRKKMEISLVEVKATDRNEGLMDEQERSIMTRLEAEDNILMIFSINRIGCHGNKNGISSNRFAN